MCVSFDLCDTFEDESDYSRQPPDHHSYGCSIRPHHFSIMASLFEMDSLFLNALKFLHSKTKSSEDQLKSLLDDVLGQKSKLAKQVRTI